MRIVTGTLKGRTIPFNSRRSGAIRLTASRLKEALFAMIDTNLAGYRFWDLCAGCGQIGLEAYSRGADVVLNEPDQRRFAQLKHLARIWKLKDLQLSNRKAQSFVSDCEQNDQRADLVYLDPPYRATLHQQPLSAALLDQLGTSPILGADALIFVQHQKELPFPTVSGCLEQVRQRNYGNTTLSIYQPSAPA